jgi:hypothetical protein
VRAGDAVWNPLSGEKALLVESPEESGGVRLVADFAVEAGGFVPGGEHVHDECTEHFEVRMGRIAFTLAARNGRWGRAISSRSRPGPGIVGGMQVGTKC